MISSSRSRLSGLMAFGLLAAVVPLGGGAAPAAAETATAAARPAFQLPFPCGQQWRLDTWGHAPALDMVKEPDQHGTEGATLLASAAGTVTMSYYHSNAGNVIQINHGGGWFTTYLHLQSRSVSVGAYVSAGQMIGQVGRTGPTANNHPHLHYEQAYDANGDGIATWGAAGTERVAPVFNGVTYGQANGLTWRNVTSNNKCTGSGGGGSTPTKYWVDTFANAPGYSSPGGTRTGTLYKGTNYVYCKVKGPKVQVGSDYNTWWLKTDLDEGNPWQNQYVSAYYLSRWGNDEARDNNGTVIPNC